MAESERLDPRRLAAQGWERRTLACEPRLSEAVQAYQSLGFEVLLVPALGEGDAGSCRACIEADGEPARYQVIYTRRTTGGRGEPDEPR